jgi:hypothetical protein
MDGTLDILRAASALLSIGCLLVGMGAVLPKWKQDILDKVREELALKDKTDRAIYVPREVYEVETHGIRKDIRELKESHKELASQLGRGFHDVLEAIKHGR